MNPGLILGYHGCSARLAEALLAGREMHLLPSNSRFEWLGKGIYCWEDSYERAYEWACQHLKPGDEPAVVGVLIKPGNCLDLLDSAQLDMLKEFAENLDRLYALAGKPVPRNRGLCHEYDCLLINRYHQYIKARNMKPFDTVRSAFAEGDSLSAAGNSSLFDRNHIQWAICSPQCIMGYFRPQPSPLG